ncbi:MAG: hypothetical protein F4106_03845 [Gemmatimonadetes bacterium]|nr:hypothetical protein [Gemmatimonadota bacterium]
MRIECSTVLPGAAGFRVSPRFRVMVGLLVVPLSLASFGLLGAQDTAGATGTVIGLVYDSTTSTPLANANVAVHGTNALAESDEAGQFRLDDVPVGEHTVVFFHPRLGTLGVSSTPQPVVVTEQAVSEVYLTVPSRATILSGWCSIEPGEGDTSIGGVVTDAITGVPLPRARVTAFGETSGVLQRRRVVQEVRTESSGEFRLCHLDSSEPLTVMVIFGSSESMPFDITRSGPQVYDVAIHIADPVTITGSVVDYATEAPIPGAHVQLVGSNHSEFTDSGGTFGFVGVPPGRQIIETSMIGYAARIDSLTVFSNEALGLEIPLATEAIALDPLVVTGRSQERVFTPPGTRFSGLTEAQVDSIIPRVVDFPALARAARVPGLSITETMLANAFGDPQIGVCIEMQRNRGRNPNACNMVEVRINDGPVPDPGFFLLDLNPQDVARIQFITPLEAGLLYGDRGANGVLLIYTR